VPKAFFAVATHLALDVIITQAKSRITGCAMTIYLALSAGVFAAMTLAIILIWHSSPQQIARREERRRSEKRLGGRLRRLLDEGFD